MDVKTITFKPFNDQHPGTSGLRKSVKHFQQPHYTESFIQSIFNALDGIKGKTVVIGGDGRYYVDQTIQTVIKMAVAQQAGKLIIGENGLLSTPAASHIIRHYAADFGIILSASHNPGGADGDFGIKVNLAAGQPAPENVTERIYQLSCDLNAYQIIDLAPLSLTQGTQTIHQTSIEIISSTEDYIELMRSLFDFDKISRYIQTHPIVFDAMHAATGPYAEALLGDVLGLDRQYLLNTKPLPDFGGEHPDPSPAHIDEIKAKFADNEEIVMGAASDGDGDRNLITGRKHFINPCDSLAIIADNHAYIPCLKNLTGVARTMPTSRALDTVATAHQLTCFETPTGWKFFANLLDANLVQLCGEESFGTSGNHIREKDGLWTVLCWLNLLAETQQTPDELLLNHWQKYGRHHFNRFDFTGLDKEKANQMLSSFEKTLKSMIGQTISGLTITSGKQFDYTDPTNDDQSFGQGLQIKFGRQARIICRLSGTDTRGATLRIYCEYWQQDIDSPPALAGTAASLATIAQGMMNLTHYFDKNQPDNIV